MILAPEPDLGQASICRADFLRSLRGGQLMETLFDGLPGAFYFLKDRESRFMGGSQSFAEMLGESSIDSILGKTDHDFSPDFLADGFVADDQEVIFTGKAIKDKIELVPSADGSLDWLFTTKIPLFDHEGAVIGLAGLARIIRDSDSVYAEHPEMHRIVDFVRQNYQDKISVSDIARAAGISASSQERLFRRTFGLTPLMYLRRTRLNAACRLLRESKTSLAEIAAQCGFSDQTNMTRAFRLDLKITPLKYRCSFSANLHGRGSAVFPSMARSRTRAVSTNTKPRQL